MLEPSAKVLPAPGLSVLSVHLAVSSWWTSFQSSSCFADCRQTGQFCAAGSFFFWLGCERVDSAASVVTLHITSQTPTTLKETTEIRSGTGRHTALLSNGNSLDEQRSGSVARPCVRFLRATRQAWAPHSSWVWRKDRIS